MSSALSLWVTSLIVFNLGITLFLFLWGNQVKIPTQEDGTSGHKWAHGVLREGIRQLPRWWYWMSLATFIIAIVYFIRYPGFGMYTGNINWTSVNALNEATTKNDVLLKPIIEKSLTSPIDELAQNEQATRIGHRLFIDNCSACHGMNAEGNASIGAPNLSDSSTLYGNDPEHLLQSINNGRQGFMPNWERFGYGKIKNLAHYVRGLSGESHDSEAAHVSEAHFAQNCAACHGADGKGNKLLGAPNLTDKDSLYGDSLESLVQTITKGRHGIMPAWKNRLSESDIRLITAWIKHNEKTQQASQ